MDVSSSSHNQTTEEVPPSRNLNASHINHEEYRLRTFQSWPIQAPISKERLAKAGFYYLGYYLSSPSNLEVVCFSCQGKLSNWTFGDCAMEKHKLAFPDCDFVNNKSNNVPYFPPNQDYNIFPHPTNHLRPRLSRHIGSHHHDDSGEDQVGRTEIGYRYMPNSQPERRPPPSSELIISHEKPYYPSFGTLAARLKTFKFWPKCLNFIKTEDFAEAGLFYTGESDHVKCFYCDGGLRDWQPGDEPWTEHARLFPLCNFVRLVKGQEFINEALWASTFFNTTTNSSSSSSQSTNETLTNGSDLDLQVDTIMKTNMVQAFLRATSYSEHLVRFSILFYVANGGRKVNLTVDDLCEMIHEFRLEDEISTRTTEEGLLHSSSSSSSSTTTAASSGVSTTTTTTSERNSNYSNRTGNSTSSSSERNQTNFSSSSEAKTNRSHNSNTTTKTTKQDEAAAAAAASAADVDERIQSLLERSMCKICLDKEVSIVFLPCGHLASCVECALILTHCAICRCEIDSTLKTYWS